LAGTDVGIFKASLIPSAMASWLVPWQKQSDDCFIQKIEFIQGTMYAVTNKTCLVCKQRQAGKVAERELVDL